MTTTPKILKIEFIPAIKARDIAIAMWLGAASELSIFKNFATKVNTLSPLGSVHDVYYAI